MSGRDSLVTLALALVVVGVIAALAATRTGQGGGAPSRRASGVAPQSFG